MKTISIIIDIAIFGFVAWVVYDAVTRYRAETGTTWDKLLAVGKGSATILIQRGAYVLAALAEFLPSLIETAGAPGVASALQTVVPGGAGPYYMLAIAVFTELARRRTLPG
jgi:hypothetical protein